jgi:hypothetical protein
MGAVLQYVAAFNNADSRRRQRHAPIPCRSLTECRVVAPATMTFDLRGKQVTQTGSSYTVALRKVGADWRLTAWAWAKGN